MFFLRDFGFFMGILMFLGVSGFFDGILVFSEVILDFSGGIWGFLR